MAERVRSTIRLRRMGGGRRNGVASSARHRRRAAVPRGSGHRRASAGVAIGVRASLADRVERGSRATGNGEAAEGHACSATQGMSLPRRGNGMAALAGDRLRRRWIRVCSVRTRLRPRVRSAAMARSALSTAVAEIHLAVDVEHRIRERRSVAVRFVMTRGTRAHVVIGRRRAVAIVAFGRCLQRVLPGHVWASAAARMARAGASLGRCVELRLAPRAGVIEEDLDVRIEMRGSGEQYVLTRGHGMAHGAGQPLGSRARHGLVAGMRTGRDGRLGEEARIPRRVGSTWSAVACRARRHAAFVGVAGRTRRSSGGGKGGGARGGIGVAVPARVDIVRVGHWPIPAAAQELRMAAIRARVGKGRRMDAAIGRGGPLRQPSTECCHFGIAHESRMIGARNRFQEKRIVCADGDRNPAIRARDGGAVIVDAPSTRGICARVAFPTSIRQ